MKKELYKDREKIQKWLKKAGITNYTIKPNFSVNVSESVYLADKKIKRIPLQFGSIEGDFDIGNNQLVSLEGSPKVVMGSFSVKNNQLKSLEFCPQKVQGYFIISNNQIKDFKYSPSEISGAIICIKNPLESLLELKSVFCGTLQYHLKDHVPIPHFEQFYDEDNILTLTHEEIKAVQVHTSLVSQLPEKSATKKLNKI